MLTELDSSDFVNGVVTELEYSRRLSQVARKDFVEQGFLMDEKIREEMARVWYDWPQGLVLLKQMER